MLAGAGLLEIKKIGVESCTFITEYKDLGVHHSSWGKESNKESHLEEEQNFQDAIKCVAACSWTRNCCEGMEHLR